MSLLALGAMLLAPVVSGCSGQETDRQTEPAQPDGATAVAAGVSPKSTPIADWERLHANVRGIVETMPAESLSVAPTPGVRTFAEQIEHVVEVNLIAVARGINQEATTPQLGGPNRLTDKVALLGYVDSGFEYVIGAIENLTETELASPVPTSGELASSTPKPRWRTLDTAREHSVWTLGQVVPYLRLAGVTPPTYGF